MKKIFISCLMLASAAAFAQNKLTPETLWKFGRLAEPKVSPDGKSVLYSVTRYSVEENKGNADLFIIPVAGGDAKQLTVTKSSENNARWRPDGKKIGYLSPESGTSQLWEVNPDGTGKRQVTNIEDGISNFNYSPKGNYIYYTRDIQMDKTLKQRYPDLPKANALEYDELMMRHWNQWEDGAYSHVFFARYTDGKISDAKDIMPGEAFDAPLMPFGGEEQLCWSSDEKTIAYTCKKLKGTDYAVSTNSDIYLYNIETEKTTNISEGNPGYDTEPRFSPDGKSLLWLSMQTAGFEADKNRLMLYEFGSGKKKDLTEGFDQSPENVLWSKDSKTIYFASATQATHQLYSYTLGAKKDVIKKLTDGLHDITSFDIAADAKKTYLIACKMDISTPTELYRTDVAAGTISQLTYTNNNILTTVKMGKVEKRMVKTTDNKDMLVWVIFPPDFDPAKKYPTLLYCQGGPQSVVSQFFSYRWNFQMMAANGYIVVAPNRRGLPSFGQQWNDEISGDWGGQCMRDYLSAIDDVSKENYVDKDRRGAVGASFGGYSVYWLAGHNENKRFKSFIAHCGVFNLESMYGETEEIFFSDHDFGGPYWKDPKPKSYEDFSPINFVKNWNAPILVIHNNKDFRVPLGQGMQAFSAAQLQGIKSRFLYFEDEGHWVTKPQNGILWQREFFRWLDETLKN